MKKNEPKKIALVVSVVVSSMLVAACGGGGGSSGSGSSNNSSGTGSSGGSTTSTASPTTGNVSTPQYAAASAQLAVFDTINQQRQQCGLPAYTENTVLDSAAQAHASYMGQNGGTITDTEVSTNPGYTGATYNDRAQHFGFPTSAYATGASAGYYTNSKLTETAYGQQIAFEWMSGVYHVAVAAWPMNELGVGWNETTYNGYPEIQSSVSMANYQTLSGSLPLTFPCQGTTGVAYAGNGETPTPPNTSGAFGAPVAVVGNSTDTIRMQSGTMTSGGTVITLQVLDSSTDPNKLLPAFEGVAYPTTPLSANTTYSVSLTGTYNGAAFSRTFSFTTGNIIG